MKSWKKKNSRKKIIGNALFVAAVFALTVYGVFHGEDLEGMMDAIREADVRWLIPGAALVLFFIWSSPSSSGTCWALLASA